MSSTVASIVPPAPLTDETFPFNRDAFIQIHNYQEKLVSCSYLKAHLSDSYNFSET